MVRTRFTCLIVSALALTALFAGCGSSLRQGAAPAASQFQLRLTDLVSVPASRAVSTPCVITDAVLGNGWTIGQVTWSNDTVTFVPPTRLAGGWSITAPPAVTGTTLKELKFVGLNLNELPTTGSFEITNCPGSSRVKLGRDAYLVHGFLSNPLVFHTMVDRLVASGYYRRVICVGYPDNQPILTSAQYLAGVVRSQTSPTDGCDLIGHSLGGLVIRTAVESLGLHDRAHNVFLLGTPHTGSDLAKLATNIPLASYTGSNWALLILSYAVNPGGYAAVLKDLASGSTFLKALNSAPKPVPSPTYDYFSIAGDVVVRGIRLLSDRVVSLPNANWSGLGGHARSYTASMVGSDHFGLPKDPESLDQLLTMIRVQHQLHP